MIPLDQQSPLPLYYQLKQRLEARIAAGEFKPGDFIPTEKELEETYRVSRTTVRQAVALLLQEGLLKVERGRGTQVVPRVEQDLSDLGGFGDRLSAQGFLPGIKVFRVLPLTADEAIADKLQIPCGSQVTLVERVILADGNPVNYITSYLRHEVGRLVDTAELEKVRSLYRLLEIQGYPVAWTDDQLSARPASQEEARHLGIKPGSPVLSANRLAYLLDNGRGMPLEWSQFAIRTDIINYTVRIHRQRG